jgi:ABC-type transporter Mla maintaining outer membrane lipid asymmetry ATPase subunit MlaF
MVAQSTLLLHTQRLASGTNASSSDRKATPHFVVISGAGRRRAAPSTPRRWGAPPLRPPRSPPALKSLPDDDSSFFAAAESGDSVSRTSSFGQNDPLGDGGEELDGAIVPAYDLDPPTRNSNSTPGSRSKNVDEDHSQLHGSIDQHAVVSASTTTKLARTSVDASSAERDHSTAEQSEEYESDVLIEFRDVHKSFGSKPILRGASFKIRRGEAVGIIGSSGTGKSTTLRLAAGLLEPDSGQVLIKGEARRGLLSDDDTTHKLKLGLVFQSGALFDSLSVRENVGFMLMEHTNMSEEAVDAAVAAALGKVGLSGVEKLYPSELSGGMRKRVALARAIVTDVGENGAGTPAKDGDTKSNKGSSYSSSSSSRGSVKDGFIGAEQLIMYDEPTAGLDPVASTVIEDLIRSMHEPNGPENANSGPGISSYVVVTHQHTTIRRAVDRIIFLHAGRVVWEGPVEEFDATDEPIVRQFASGSLHGPIVYV